MKKIYCPYLNEHFDENLFSLEHIIPYSLGGGGDFSLSDISKKGNNDAGSKLDSKLINNWLITTERWKLGIKSQNGNIPPLIFKGTIDLDGTTVEATYSVDHNSNILLTSIPIVNCDWEKNSISVNCNPDDLRQILQNINKKAKSKGGTLNIDSIIEKNSNKVRKIENPQMQVQMSLGVFDFLPAYLKMALATGHLVLGQKWTQGTDAELIRKMMWEEDVSKYPNYKLHGSVWPNTNAAGVKEILKPGEDLHLCAILNTNPVSFYCILFNQFDGMVKLADGIWQNGEMQPGDGVIFLTNPKTRKTYRFGFMEYIYKKSVNQLNIT